MKPKYNLGIWESRSIWHIISINTYSIYNTQALCDNFYNAFFMFSDEPEWIYPYYNRTDVNVNKKTLCDKCLKISGLSWEDIVQYLINIKLGIINAEKSQIRKNKIAPKLL